MTSNPMSWVGTGLSDQIDGAGQDDTLIGLAGDDQISGHSGDDILHGDYVDANLLDGTDGASAFSDYAESGTWAISALDDGHQQMTQTIATEIGGVYNLNLELAANFAAGRADAAIEVLVNGVVVAEFASQSGAFAAYEVQFTADSADAEITIRSIDAGGNSPAVDTTGPAFHYAKDMQIGGETVTVAAFADGQSNLYQVLNGTLHVFDVGTQTYELAGAQGTVNVNSLGYNAEDDLLYAIAVGDGVDSLGQPVSRTDLVMIDAEGLSYRVGETPYRSWTGDFDDNGNLWSFQSSMDRVAVIDVDQFDANGNPVTTVFKLPKDLVNVSVYDVAFDAATQTFYGVARPSAEGADTILLVVDISSGDPVFSTVPVTSTVVDGVTLEGAPAMTFGAAIIDADGNLFVGGNSGDHDMNDATRASGGIYRVIVDAETGEASLHLIEQAPQSYSNDGAADPTAQNPFSDVDLTSSVLVRDLSLVATTEGALSYDDTLSGNAGQDTISGGIGDDSLVGGSAGDSLIGATGADTLHGGAGADSTSTTVSTYDANGVRYDQFGNVLAPDDDFLFGGAGDDDLSGSAGHDTLDGGDANDTLNGGSGFDNLYGGDGNDTLNGGAHTDTLWGGTGDDLLQGGSGDDVLLGGVGQDTLLGGSGADVLSGDDGADELSGGSGNDSLTGGDDADSLSGGSGQDSLIGGDGADTANGGSGNDVLQGDNGDDVLVGGTGNDVLSGNAGTDRMKGGSNDDLLDGGDSRDFLNAGSGNDTLFGGSGSDRFYMGAGDDIATGGDHADRFVFRNEDIDGSTDVITDFSTSEGDILDLRRLDLGVQADDEAWFDENASLENGNVTITLGNDTTLVLQGTTDSLEQVFDNIWF